MTPEPNAEGSPASVASRTPLWRRLLPFALAIGLTAFVLSRLDFAAFMTELGRVNYPAFLGFAAAFVFALLTADALGTTVVYRATIAKIAFRDIWILRGASYLPSLLNHHVGQAFLTYFLSRAHGVPLARVAGATLLVYASWTGCLLLLASAALLVSGRPVAWLLLPLGAGLVYLVVLGIRPRVLAHTRLLAPLFEAGIRGHMIALVARLPHLAVVFLGTWIPFWFFGVRIPLKDALPSIPILMVAITLPLTPQGFGTRDVLAAQLFERFADGASHEQRLATIAAATASWGVAITIVEVLFGLLLMRRAAPKLAPPSPSEPAS